ncbi:hypothetical protein GWK47_006404 [Chionoecetes opilio]|uniref:Uncharacterized protein n=1 Tax=Chionoecetes opilio TaxID=41210 RepID=A0A8J4YCR7_CHIOP|nr:hypothetical protein GWK47_006404 [Chionoecetes opilio]
MSRGGAVVAAPTTTTGRPVGRLNLLSQHPGPGGALQHTAGCDANSSFYGKVKNSMYDQVMKSPVAQRQLSRCGDSLDLDEEVVEDLFEFTRHVIYDDHKSNGPQELRLRPAPKSGRA